MRLWKILLPLAAALLVLAGLSLGQDGPNRDNSQTVARPRQAPNSDSNSSAAPSAAPTDADLPKIPSEFSKKGKPETAGLANFKSDVDLVSLDVAVLDNKSQFIPGIPKEDFRILEDNVPQQISSVNMGDAPITVAMVIEFSNLFQQYWGPTWYQTLSLAWGFLQTLKPEDYVAVVAYDIRPEMLTDFTQDKMKAREAMQRLTMAGFSEANLFDAITDTADRMSGIEGRKAIVLISSGIDTFSKITFDQCRKSLQQSGVPIYAIGLMQALREMADARGGMGPIQRMDFLQADNEMNTFARETGGRAFFPRFYGEFGTIFQAIHQALRNQYVLTYTSSNKAHDGAFRKVKVELVNPSTNEQLRLTDEKNKPIKYQIVAKGGYKAPRTVE
jgi:Ca-activated chloride channel homolog